MRPMRKGERRVGRAKGTPNKMTREIKEALINAAELSKHSAIEDTGRLCLVSRRQ
jgi:hypothetical protein